MAASERKRATRRYRPRLEALEAIRLLDAGITAALLPTAVELRTLDEPAAVEVAGESHDAWDQVLGTSNVAELLGGPGALASVPSEALASGLNQLERYLGRAWARAGIAPQQYEDCTQSVYLSLMEQLGTARFACLAGGVGLHGVREVLSWETPEGPDFFRAVDMVKKRTQRTKPFQSLDDHLDSLTDQRRARDDSREWLGLLHEVMDTALSAREANLIRLTLDGNTPADIAQAWGVSAKTVSNEKSLALRKLRDVFLAEAN